MKRKPIVGETLFSVNIGNATSRYQPQKLTPMVVSAVGKKYFTLESPHGKGAQFHLDTWREKTEYCENHKLYETEQDWLDEAEEREICKMIGDSFQYGDNNKNLSIEALRKIKDILLNAWKSHLTDYAEI